MTGNGVQLALGVTVAISIAFVLRWYYVTTALIDSPLRGDATQYFSYAWNLFHHHTFSIAKADAETIVPDAYRDPGYPLLLAAWMAVIPDFEIARDFETWYRGVLLTQAVLGALTAGMAVLLARLWLPLNCSVLAGVLVAFWPHEVTIAGYLLSEPLYGFLAVLAMLMFGLALKRGAVLTFMLAGVCFGLATLTNSVFMPLVVLLPLVALWRGHGTRQLLLAFAMCGLALPGAWNIRNAFLPSTGLGSTDRAKQNLVVGSWPFFQTAWREAAGLEPFSPLDMPVENREARRAAARDSLLPEQREEQAMARSFGLGSEMMAARFAGEPLRYARWYFVEKPASLWAWDIQIGQGDVYIFPTTNSPLQTVPALRALVSFLRASNPFLGLAALVCTVLVLIRRVSRSVVDSGFPTANDTAALTAVAVLFAYVTLLHTLLQAEPRYSIPYRPFEIMLAITAIVWLFSWLAKRRAVKAPGTG